MHEVATLQYFLFIILQPVTSRVNFELIMKRQARQCLFFCKPNTFNDLIQVWEHLVGRFGTCYESGWSIRNFSQFSMTRSGKNMKAILLKFDPSGEVWVGVKMRSLALPSIQLFPVFHPLQHRFRCPSPAREAGRQQIAACGCFPIQHFTSTEYAGNIF